jgi:hypothetical protein
VATEERGVRVVVVVVVVWETHTHREKGGKVIMTIHKCMGTIAKRIGTLPPTTTPQYNNATT